MSTQTQEKPQETAAAMQSKGEVAVFSKPRLPYHQIMEKEFGVDRAGWRALTESIFPLAETADSILLALAYCKARKLDPFKRVVHIVPMWNSALGRIVETVWPGIAEHRTTAFRTKSYAGADPTDFGDTRTVEYQGSTKKGEALKAKLTRPDWCQITVYRLIDGVRIAFPGPRVWFDETYSQRKGAAVPNERWCRAPSQMLEKCAEAAALRKAFPEELGDEPTAEEMEGQIYQGKTIEGTVIPESDAPARPTRATAADTPHDATTGEIIEGHAEEVEDSLATAEALGEADAKAGRARDPDAHGLDAGPQAMAYLAGWDAAIDAAFPGDQPKAQAKK